MSHLSLPPWGELLGAAHQWVWRRALPLENVTTTEEKGTTTLTRSIRRLVGRGPSDAVDIYVTEGRNEKFRGLGLRRLGGNRVSIFEVTLLDVNETPYKGTGGK